LLRLYVNRAQTLLLALLIPACCAVGAAEPRLVRKLAVDSRRTVVVAEGDLEPRSIGSYSVRLYSTEQAQEDDDTTFFSSGLVRGRDGEVERVFLAKLDRNEPASLIVTVRSAGSGGYLSAQAFGFAAGRVEQRASVSGLAPHADPLGALRAALRRTNSNPAPATRPLSEIRPRQSGATLP